MSRSVGSLVSCLVSEWAGWTIVRSVSEEVCLPKWFGRSVSQSVNQPASQLVAAAALVGLYFPISQSTSQSVSQSIGWLVSE